MPKKPITPIRISEEERAFLRDLGAGNISRGARLAIEAAKAIRYTTTEVPESPETIAKPEKAPKATNKAPNAAEAKPGLCSKCQRFGRNPKCPECGENP